MEEKSHITRTNSSQARNALARSLPFSITSSTFLAILDILPDALVGINQDGTILMLNTHAQDMFGYSQQELRGQPLETLLPERFREVHLAHRTHFFSAPRTRPMGVGLQLYGRHKDGTEIPVDISLSPLLLENQIFVIAAIRDVTEQRRIERERAQQIQRIALQSELINQANDAILVLDPIDRILLWNRGAERLYGWSAGEALGRVARSLLKTHVPGGRAEVDASLKEHGVWEGELLHTCRDGNQVIVESRQVLVRDQQGNTLALLEINRDITSRRQKEEATQAEHTKTLAQLSMLQEMDYLKDEFIGIAAHELRTPLAVLAGYVDMLLTQTARGRGPTLADWQEEALQEIKGATHRMVTLTDDLLDLSRLQAGRLLLSRAPTNLVSLLKRCIAGFRPTLTRHHLELHQSRDSLIADVDPQRLEQIVSNLIGNAIKYSPKGGTILITLQDEASGTLLLSIQDHGIGIPAHQQDQIFGRFIRADNARALGIGGTGLGLYLSRSLAEQHGGHLWFSSEEGKGSTFYLQLPLVSPSAS